MRIDKLLLEARHERQIELSCSATVSDLQSEPITEFRGYCLTDGDVDREWESIGIEMLGN
jgi:hypothetical protein